MIVELCEKLNSVEEDNIMFVKGISESETSTDKVRITKIGEESAIESNLLQEGQDYIVAITSHLYTEDDIVKYINEYQDLVKFDVNHIVFINAIKYHSDGSLYKTYNQDHVQSHKQVVYYLHVPKEVVIDG